jgi:hypothetical protein
VRLTGWTDWHLGEDAQCSDEPLMMMMMVQGDGSQPSSAAARRAAAAWQYSIKPV